MERTKILSSNIASVGYNDGTLEVEFKGGSIYQYEGISSALVLNFLLAPSRGSFFHRFIKDFYHCIKLDPTSGEEGSDE